MGLVRRPDNIFQLGLDYKPINKLSYGILIKYVGGTYDVSYNSSLGPYGALGKVKVSEYTLVDIFSHYDIMKGLSAGLKIENLFNEQYVEINGFATRGRSIYLKLRYTL